MNNKEKLVINWGLLIGGVISAVLGIVLIVFHDSSKLINIVQITIGITVIAVNGNNIYRLLGKDNNDVTYNRRLIGYIVNIVVGLCLIIAPNDTFRTIVLIFLIIIPIIEILLFSNIPGIVSSCLFQIFLGIIVLILGLNGVIGTAFIIVGVILAFAGIFNILNAFSIIKYKRN